ncbi:tRNA (adenosine(37)-N6)-threonylcarbamoyltransferase complex ATPase subunit type 1 TsaE [Ideonella livida]|uniref:tRNA threonylcarbamoyladenosine biosynthesis protein TsaE n=1 Tax=Ideonella livida TaxID=2707176 RepID=A0A7C9PFT3_9BURK|nr:tRNA (adenosine(37)-N6)-threonylcarbamoyltransferase complex ATPase subunit type 1 TsaE [Ideonella livida]NDY90836.1 tRNA (adenosine(37)-N6)-threonylcarbamoyltransferase complex ATPase subunit type 1 TsaE [Ideonella livida]
MQRLLPLNHPPILETRLWRWPDETACEASAQALARGVWALPALAALRLELDGPLGAGKTTFTRHLLRALGVQGRVKSPTYAVVEPYQLSGPQGRTLEVAHFDFYRFSDPREWEDAGLRELFDRPGLCLSEWASKAHPWLPGPDLRLVLTPQDDESREVALEVLTAQGLQWLAVADGNPA